MMNTMNFTDKIIVITGASKGFGKALAIAFIKNGGIVTITSTNEAEIKTTAKEIGAEYLASDASSFDAQNNIAKQVINNYGRIDVWVNNAGIQISPSNI